MSKNFKLFVVVLLIASLPAQCSVWDSIANAFDTATDAVSDGFQDALDGIDKARDATRNALDVASNATRHGLDVARNATRYGLDVAANETNKWTNTARDNVKDFYNTTKNDVRDWTTDVRDGLHNTSDKVRNSARDFGNSVRNHTDETFNDVSDSFKSARANVSALHSDEIYDLLRKNSSNYVDYASSILLQLGKNRSEDMEDALSQTLVENYNDLSKNSSRNDTVSLAIAEAVVTSLVTANNYSIIVDDDNKNRSVNATQVGDFFVSGLQGSLTPCAQNVSRTLHADNNDDYFKNIAKNCCPIISNVLTDAIAIATSNNVADVLQNSIDSSQELSREASLDLNRCIANNTATA